MLFFAKIVGSQLVFFFMKNSQKNLLNFENLLISVLLNSRVGKSCETFFITKLSA